MTTNTQFFTVRDLGAFPSDEKGLQDKIVSILGAEPPSKAPRELSRTFLETFDWRLYGAGAKLILEKEKDSKTTHLLWRETGTKANRSLAVAVKKPPYFSHDFPKGPIKDKVTGLISMRSLCLKVEVVTRERLGAIVDELGKTVVRFALEHNQLRSSDGKSLEDLGYRVRLEMVRGYAPFFHKANAKLKAAEGLTATDDKLMEQAFEKQGRRPLDYSSKEAATLSPSMTAWEACRQIFLIQLAHIERNIEGTIKDWDSEFLHDLRVAVRRSRSLINRMKECLPDEVLGRFSEDLAWLGEITGPTRDMDVYLLDFPKYRDSLEEQVQEDILPLQDYLVEHQYQTQKALAKHLRSARFKKFIKDWHAYLAQPTEPYGLPDAGRTPVREIAGQRIWKTYRRVIREGKAIADASPAEALHDLRKTCKKMRYILEFFASLYGKGQVARIIKSLKVLQDNLGVFQDLDVQAASLKEFSHGMMAEGGYKPDTFLAMGMLVEGFMRRKADVRNHFYERFAVFADPKNHELFRQICQRPAKESDKGGSVK